MIKRSCLLIGAANQKKIFLIGFVWLLLVSIAVAEKKAPEKLITSSGQFVIHGGSQTLRSTIGNLAEESSETLDQLITLSGKWKHPIVIELLEGKRERQISTRFYQLPKGFRFQINVNIRNGIDTKKLQSTLIELMLYERSLRSLAPEKKLDRIALDLWIREGVIEGLRWKNGDYDRDFYRSIFENPLAFSPEKLLEESTLENMDAGSRAAYRASAGILVLALLEQKKGRRNFGILLGEAATFEGEPMTLLQRHFPGINLSEKSLSKWWSLQLAKISEPLITRLMTIVESEAQLESILNIRYVNKEKKQVEIAPHLYGYLLEFTAEERSQLLNRVTSELGVLQFQIFPSYRVIVQGYLKAIHDLSEETSEEVGKKLRELYEMRRGMLAAGLRARDYLDWYQISSANGVSGEFDDYLEIIKRLDREERPKGESSISDYLDDLQKVYSDD